MLRPSPGTHVYLYAGVVDMRKSIDGLAALVEQELELNPMTEALFVFCNRGRDKIKLLYWSVMVLYSGTSVWKNSVSPGYSQQRPIPSRLMAIN